MPDIPEDKGEMGKCVITCCNYYLPLVGGRNPNQELDKPKNEFQKHAKDVLAHKRNKEALDGFFATVNI